MTHIHRKPLFLADCTLEEICRGNIILLFFHGATTPNWSGLNHDLSFETTHRHTTLGSTPLDE